MAKCKKCQKEFEFPRYQQAFIPEGMQLPGNPKMILLIPVCPWCMEPVG